LLHCELMVHVLAPLGYCAVKVPFKSGSAEAIATRPAGQAVPAASAMHAAIQIGRDFRRGRRGALLTANPHPPANVRFADSNLRYRSP
jgi:hypothetical protein